MKKIILILLLISRNLFSQIGINPPVIFIDPETRSAQLTLTNTGLESKQIELFFKFGYTISDTMGKPELKHGDSLPLNKNSLSPYIKVFPKKIILEPSKEQTVRFLLKNAASIPDGTYWTRVVIKSMPVLKQQDTTSRKSTGQMVLVTESNTIVVYEKGKVNTELSLKSIKSVIDSQNVHFLMDFERGGNSPFWGTVNINLYDKNEDIVDMKSEITPIYSNGIRRFSIDRKKLEAGEYNAEIIINSEHPDIKDNLKIKIKPIETSFKFKVLDETQEASNSVN
jgi:hypothetical protein